MTDDEQRQDDPDEQARPPEEGKENPFLKAKFAFGGSMIHGLCLGMRFV